MNIRVTFSGKVKDLEIRSRSESESEQGDKSEGVDAKPSDLPLSLIHISATLLRLSPNYQFYPRPLLAVTYFRYPRLSWLDGRCVQGPGTYSPRHGGCAITSESSFTKSGCRLRSELREVFGIGILSPGSGLLYLSLIHN